MNKELREVDNTLQKEQKENEDSTKDKTQTQSLELLTPILRLDQVQSKRKLNNGKDKASSSTSSMEYSSIDDNDEEAEQDIKKKPTMRIFQKKDNQHAKSTLEVQT